MTRLTDQNIALGLTLPDVRSPAVALAVGTAFLLAGLAAAVWVYGALPFVFESLTTLFGGFVMSLLALLLFVYGWSFLGRGLSAVVAEGVRDGMAGRD